LKVAKEARAENEVNIMNTCSICNGKGSFSKNSTTNEDIPCWFCKGSGNEKSLFETYPNATKRQARKKVSVCEKCKQKINIGDFYMDTHEKRDMWATYKYCMKCCF